MNKFFYFLIILLSVFLIFNFVNSILFDNPFDFLESFIYSLVFTLIYLGLEGHKKKKVEEGIGCFLKRV
ncbi:membrane protein [Staphylococcus aureus W64953]|nr:membrane protein [Staphylococcus aureus W64953]